MAYLWLTLPLSQPLLSTIQPNRPPKLIFFFFFFFLKSALDYGFPTLYITHSAGCLLAVNCWLPACLVGVALSIPGSFRPLHVAPHLSHAGCELLAACMFDWCCLIYDWVLQTTTCSTTLITCWLWVVGCLHVWLVLPWVLKTITCITTVTTCWLWIVGCLYVWLVLPNLYLGPSDHYMYHHTHHMLAVDCWLPVCLIGVALGP